MSELTPQHLLLPMTFYILCIWAFTFVNFFIRRNAILRKEMPGTFFKSYQGDVTRRVQIAGRHLDNQFQLPVIFFVIGGIHVALGLANEWTHWMAWGFVLSRLIHSYVHLGNNKIYHRAGVYAVSWLFVVGLWVQSVLLALGPEV